MSKETKGTPKELSDENLDKVAGGGIEIVNATVAEIRIESLNNKQHQAKAPATESLSLNFEEIKVKY